MIMLRLSTVLITAYYLYWLIGEDGMLLNCAPHPTIIKKQLQYNLRIPKIIFL